ncbi:MAG TPA: endonuclease III [Anaeromyxobacteraceae bacterium]|nr:endonuclease III [Anaeromyxobacteraceae bacterium]
MLASRFMAARKPSRPTAERRARAAEIVDRLERAMPDVKIALHYGSDVELLVAVILSAQSTDAGVNKATPALFAAFPDAAAFASASPEALWPYTQRVGLYRNKSKAIVAAMKAIVAEHGGRVPRTREALEALPGVGRKTAGVVLVHLGAANAFPVDTHVGRIARRLGLTREENPDKVERDLCALLPEERWAKGHQLFVWHGRRVCKALAPACSRCPVEPLCPKRGVPAAIRH